MENFDIDFYKKSHKDFANYSNNELVIHWIKVGKTHSKLPNKKVFYDKFPDFSWKVYKSLNPDLEKKGYNTEELLINHYWEIGQYEKRKYMIDNKKSTLKIEKFKSNLGLNKNKNIIFPNSNESLIYVDFSDDFKIQMQHQRNYIILNFKSIINNDYIQKLKNLTLRNNQIFFLQGELDKIPVIVHKCVDTGLYSIIDIIKMRKNIINYEIIGFNDKINNNFFYHKLYYYYGLLNLNLNILGHKHNLHYIDFLNGINNNNYNFEIDKIYKFYYYKCGQERAVPVINKIKTKIEKSNLKTKTENCILFSKKIIGYGGNQKTSLQLIELLDKHFFVKIISNDMSDDDEFSYKNDFLVNDISNDKIVKLKKKKDIIEYLNQNNFKFIINNKLNQFFDIIDKINNKNIFIITHASADPYNQLILDNQKYIYKLLTINNFTIDLLENYNLKCKTAKYYNYVNKETKIPQRKEFTYSLVYVGRLSKEKNIELLIQAFKNFKSTFDIPNLKLNVIGDGPKLSEYIAKQRKNKHFNINFFGKREHNEILKIIKKSDYLILPSFTEGLPFSILESMSVGIPCIYSNISGANEIINKNNGFLVNFYKYEKYKNSLDYNEIFENMEQYYNNHVKELTKTIEEAYSISIERYNILSNNCYTTVLNNYIKNITFDYNLKLFNVYQDNKKLKIFMNFKPNFNIPYGGGNINAYYIQKLTSGKNSNYDIVYELQDGINIYLIIDPLKDSKFKLFDIDDIINHRNFFNKEGKILIRVNDCDITRPSAKKNNLSREEAIIKNIDHLDFLIFNSNFIKNYYLSKINRKINNTVIYNGCNNKIFYPANKKLNSKIKIVTHHWSNNMLKGYEIYKFLDDFCKKNSDKFEFVFIGKNVPDMFKDVKIHGPYINDELANKIKECDIYVTASKFDSCPNHVIEGICCGLPILYQNLEGGGKELCQSLNLKIGEIFNDKNDITNSLMKIINNYNFYKNNILKKYKSFDYVTSTEKYFETFDKITCKNLIFEKNINIYGKVSIKFNFKTKNFAMLKINNDVIYIQNGINNIIIDLNQNDKNLLSIFTNENNFIKEDYEINNFQLSKYKDQKLNNNKLNILLCSDNKYFVGLFACLCSVIKNIKFDNLNNVHFNFIIPINDSKNFYYYMKQFLILLKTNIKISIIYFDYNCIPNVIKTSKCFNGGNHLLNVGNFSRLLLGNIFDYDKLIYLDSDSIVNTDIYEKLINIPLNINNIHFLSPKADKINSDNKKQLIIKFNNILNENYNFSDNLNLNINFNDYCYYGAPFYTNCKVWNNLEDDIIKIISLHNKEENGIYKLFTMSIQNLLFFNKTSNLNEYINCLSDLGSDRKNWDENDLISSDILDWSGVFKPWYTNGLYKNKWIKYDILNLSENNFISKIKNSVETFS